MSGEPGRVVVAIGGNALSPPGEPTTVANQFRHTRESMAPVSELAGAGWKVAIVHGNGPQVGDELRRGELARDEVEPLPLGVLVASTAGWIGYMIQQSLENALERHEVDRRVVTLITQVQVDPEVPTSRRPRKFVGREVAPGDAGELRDRGYDVAEDAGGRLRRRVASPEPTTFVEAAAVRELVEEGTIVIAGGGGGVPVYRDPRLGLEGLDVVVDKDRAAALLAEEIGASTLLILTDVDGVYRNFGTPDARLVDRLDPDGARELLASGALGEGSMQPKVEACLAFVEGTGRRAVIAQLASGAEALAGDAGTEVLAG